MRHGAIRSAMEWRLDNAVRGLQLTAYKCAEAVTCSGYHVPAPRLIRESPTLKELESRGAVRACR